MPIPHSPDKDSTYLWNPPPVPSLPVRGQRERYPVNRLFFVGRNYHAHALEMSRPVDKANDRPFYFTKSVTTLVESGATVAYPPEMTNYHYEMELVVAIGTAGFRVKAAAAHQLIYGYACGLDMTRRDLQLAARDKGRPWDLGKDIEGGSVVAEIVPMQGAVLDQGELVMTVNGQPRTLAAQAEFLKAADQLPNVPASFEPYVDSSFLAKMI